jgi:hypothetical protein
MSDLRLFLSALGTALRSTVMIAVRYLRGERMSDPDPVESRLERRNWRICPWCGFVVEIPRVVMFTEEYSCRRCGRTMIGLKWATERRVPE